MLPENYERVEEDWCYFITFGIKFFTWSVVPELITTVNFSSSPLLFQL